MDENTVKMNRPYYYRTNDGVLDVYNMEIQLWGFTAWYEHAMMECLQYLFRARYKDDFLSDLDKVLHIVQRMKCEYIVTLEGDDAND